MPNWCSCDLIISGNKNHIEQFKEYAKNNEPNLSDDEDSRLLDMNKFIPYPEQWKKMDEEAYEARLRWGYLPGGVRRKTPYPNIKDGYNQGGYSWCLHNWGTKWNFCEVKIVYENPKSIMYTFETAWSPPLPVIVAMSNKFEGLRLTLKYYEMGYGFQGTFIVKNGMILKDESNSNYRGERGG